MAKDTYSNRSRGNRRDEGNSAVYKITGAIVLLAVSIFLMRLVADNYSTIGGLDIVYPITKIAAIAFGVLAAASLAALVFVKTGWCRTVCPYVLAVSALYAFTALVLRITWMDYVTALTILHVALFGLYIVWMLYGKEFFLVSLITVVAGSLFYRFSRGIGLSVSCLVLSAALVLMCAAGAYIASNAARHKGVLVLGGRKFPLFRSRFDPLALYITCAVWLLCFVACLVFGAGFAYYCMFAAVAFELIAAVYYTFQLR